MRAAAIWGGVTGLGAYLILRLGLALLTVLLFGSGSADLDHPGIFASSCLGIFALLFAFSAAGYFAGRDSLRAGMGALAGVISVAVYAALSALYTPQTSGPAGVAATPAPGTQPLPAAAQAASTIVAAALVFGIAALMGWLGGRPGAQNARRQLAAAGKAATRKHSHGESEMG
jgi:hypothetical protein